MKRFVLLLLMPLAMSASVRGETLGPVGGTGGTSRFSGCGEMKQFNQGNVEHRPNHYLIGINVRVAGWLDQISAICAPLGGTQNGRAFWGQAIQNGVAIGGTGGQPIQRICPQNQIVVAMRGRAGWYVDQVRIGCRAVNDVGRATGSITWLAAVGGTGGNSFGPLQCINDGIVDGLRARGGSYVDAISLGCSPKVENYWNGDRVVQNFR